MSVKGQIDRALFMEGIPNSHSSSAEIDSMEASLASIPEDRRVHLHLMGYYWGRFHFYGDRSLRHKLVTESDWFALHEPGSAALQYMINSGGFSLSPEDFAGPYAGNLERYKADWFTAVSADPNDTTVIRHALAIMEAVDSNLAAFCLTRLRALMPTYPQYVGQLAEMYVAGIAEESRRPGARPGSDPAGPYERLVQSSDSVVIGVTGQMTLVAAKIDAKGANSLEAVFGTALLEKAHQLDGTNSRWVAALNPVQPADGMQPAMVYDQLRQEDLWANGKVPKMPAPAGTIVVSAEAQAAKLTLPSSTYLTRVLSRPDGPGEVRLKAVIDTDGKVQQLRFESGSVHFFPIAMEIASGCRYEPTLSDGKPVSVEMIIELNFVRSPKPHLFDELHIRPASRKPGELEYGPKAIAPVPKANAVTISGSVMADMLVEKTQPKYPQMARMLQVTGAVVLHGVIAKDGVVESLEVVSGPAMLRMAALDAVKDWKYKPYLINGEATPVDMTITVQFTREDRDRYQRQIE